MIKFKSLLNGIGNIDQTNKYYDDWSSSYDNTLYSWNYKAPKKTVLVIKSNIKSPITNILDLACGTGLFAEEIKKIYPNIIIDGIDISKRSIKEASNKKIYNNLLCRNFENIDKKKKYNLVSLIGAMTYCQDPKNFLLQIHNITKKNGYFIFTHRLDLWKKQDFSNLIISFSKKWKETYLSKPMVYLPKNKEFSNKIKIHICLLKKIN